MSDLARLLDDHAATARLTDTEANVLRMAAGGASHERLASVYGFKNAEAAERAVARIRCKLEGKSEPIGSLSANGRAADSSQVAARPSVATSTSRAGAPADARRAAILAYVAKHGQAKTGALCRDLDIPNSTALRLLNELIAAGELERRGLKSASHVVLAGSPPSAAAAPKPPIAPVKRTPAPSPPIQIAAPAPEVTPGLQHRYVELLLAYLEGGAEAGEDPTPLMDRIERVLGIAA